VPPIRETDQVRSRVVVPVLAVGLAAIALAVLLVQGASAPAPRTARATLAVRPHFYLGVYERESPAGYQMVQDFAQTVGQEPNLAGYYSGWGEQFQTGFAQTARSHGAATLLQMDPTDASVSAIAAGDYDDYLRAYADAVRDFGHPVVIGFGHEMNATWYSWGYGHVAPRTFVAAWRHVVTVFRQQGADNVTWMWTIQADTHGTGPIQEWWPGRQYVTWVGIDGYYYKPSDTFATVFGPTIAQVRFLTGKPVLLSETAVGPEAGQAAKIQDLFRGMATYGALGLVWFDITQNDGIYHQNWRIEDSRAAAESFRLAAQKYLRS
jgi:mannan endo-1,4-beta-mannosidase